MTVTLNFSPDIEAGLLAQARAEGLDVADYVGNLVRKQIAANAQPQTLNAHPTGKKKRLSELLAPLHGLDVDFSRNSSTGRPVNL